MGPSEEWSGVTFGLGDARLACNIDRISEILPCPQSTPVPGAKPWIIGLANVRGELLTVIDFARYLTGVRSPIRSNSRLLATSLNKAPIGLLVDEVFGQRHFLDSDAVDADLAEDSPMRSGGQQTTSTRLRDLARTGSRSPVQLGGVSQWRGVNYLNQDGPGFGRGDFSNGTRTGSRP